MGIIVCATRGGEGSRIAQLLAVRQAKQRDSALVFLYIVDTNVAEDHDESLNPALEAELSWLGRVLLGVAQDRAARLGKEASTEVRTGRVHEEIVKYLKAHDVDLLILGAPRGTSRNTFGDDAIERFADHINQETGVTVRIARPEEQE